GVDDVAEAIADPHRFATGRKLSAVRAEDKATLTAARADCARPKSPDVGRNVKSAGGWNDGPWSKGKINGAFEFPTRNIDRERRGIGKRDELVVLVARGRIVVNARNGHIGVGRLGQRKAGVLRLAGADRKAGVGDRVLAIKMV